jgi:hypothetical protein
MKCACGFERNDKMALCRMIAEAPGSYRVKIYAPDGQLLTESGEALSMRNGLAYVERIVAGRYEKHFHWDEHG